MLSSRARENSDARAALGRSIAWFPGAEGPGRGLRSRGLGGCGPPASSGLCRWRGARCEPTVVAGRGEASRGAARWCAKRRPLSPGARPPAAPERASRPRSRPRGPARCHERPALGRCTWPTEVPAGCPPVPWARALSPGAWTEVAATATSSAPTHLALFSLTRCSEDAEGCQNQEKSGV